MVHHVKVWILIISTVDPARSIDGTVMALNSYEFCVNLLISVLLFTCCIKFLFQIILSVVPLCSSIRELLWTWLVV